MFIFGKVQVSKLFFSLFHWFTGSFYIQWILSLKNTLSASEAEDDSKSFAWNRNLKNISISQVDNKFILKLFVQFTRVVLSGWRQRWWPLRTACTDFQAFSVNLWITTKHSLLQSQILVYECFRFKNKSSTLNKKQNLNFKYLSVCWYHEKRQSGHWNIIILTNTTENNILNAFKAGLQILTIS